MFREPEFFNLDIFHELEQDPDETVRREAAAPRAEIAERYNGGPPGPQRTQCIA